MTEHTVPCFVISEGEERFQQVTKHFGTSTIKQPLLLLYIISVLKFGLPSVHLTTRITLSILFRLVISTLRWDAGAEPQKDYMINQMWISQRIKKHKKYIEWNNKS